MIVILISGIGAGSSYLVQQQVVGPSFDRAERERAEDDSLRCVQALKRECEYIARYATDYAHWDDTYAFVVDHNQAYIDSNLQAETFKNLAVDMIAIIDQQGALVWGEVHDENRQSHPRAADVLRTLTEAGSRLVTLEDQQTIIAGVLMTPIGPLLIGSQAISNSKNDAPPRGVFVMGRMLNQTTIQELADRTRVWSQFWPIAEIPRGDIPAFEHLRHSNGGAWVRVGTRDLIHGYALIRDVFGAPALLQRANMPRSISRHARAAAELGATMTVLGGITVSLALWIALSRLVLTPLERVTEHAVQVGSNDDFTRRLEMPGNDEIATLGREIDRMVDRLALSRAQLIDIAHQAGKAEVATSVLHNVGNVLNSVNVSANLAIDKLKKSELPSLGMAANLLAEHRHELGAFLERDEHGRELPGFLTELSTFLSEEQSSVLIELKSLTDSLEHIRNVINMQQVHGKTRGVIERVDPAEVVEQSLQLSAASFERHKIRVERNFQNVGAIPMDRHRVLQVLVNLISNATHAVKQQGGDGRLALSLKRSEDRRIIRISVTDNGVGIAPERLTQIFGMGFSMRPGGHGFGLHSAANMAKEMNGSLAAASDGVGHGATFTLELPVAQEVRA